MLIRPILNKKEKEIKTYSSTTHIAYYERGRFKKEITEAMNFSIRI